MGRPLFLGDFDSMVERYPLAASNQGVVLTTATAVSGAKVLLKKYQNAVGNNGLESSSWTKSFYQRMGFVQWIFILTRVDIHGKSRKGTGYQFHYDIVSKVEQFKIPISLVINLDQTPSPIVRGRKQMMAIKSSQKITITAAADKKNITATFAVTLSGEFLPIQLIYSGKMEQTLRRYKFPDLLCLIVNEKHY